MKKVCTVCDNPYESKKEGVSGLFLFTKVDFCGLCLACMGEMVRTLGEEE